MPGHAARRSLGSASRRLALVVLFASFGAACGEECAKCSSDDDCPTGLVCSTFDDGSTRCASGVGATTCRVR